MKVGKVASDIFWFYFEQTETPEHIMCDKPVNKHP